MQNAKTNIAETSGSVNFSETTLKNFWSKVNKTDTCWIWTGCTNAVVYGGFNIGRRQVRAHRISWMIHNGTIPKGNGYHGTCVCHSCDNPLCVNPSHLFLGSQSENIQDMIKKGRNGVSFGDKNGMRKHPESVQRGSLCTTAKLDEDKVIQIKKRVMGGEKQSSIAREFSVTKTTISYIMKRKSWRHVSI